MKAVTVEKLIEILSGGNPETELYVGTSAG